jgi:hypothetical protein
MSERILPLFSHVVWLNADRMLDTNLISMLLEYEFEPAIVATPLRITTHFECDSFVVLEVVAVFKHVTDAEFDCTSLFIPVERVQVIPNETMSS